MTIGKPFNLWLPLLSCECCVYWCVADADSLTQPPLSAKEALQDQPTGEKPIADEGVASGEESKKTGSAPATIEEKRLEEERAESELAGDTRPPAESPPSRDGRSGAGLLWEPKRLPKVHRSRVMWHNRR